MTRTAEPAAEAAPAKLNLCLHVTGRYGGYHLLDSLVAFAGVGDRLSAEPASSLSLALSGPFADALPAGGNLVLRAAEALAAHAPGRGAALLLEKELPVAAGIGGGSADAAAALRLLSRLWDVAVPQGLAPSLGADVPVCMGAPAPQRMRGIGERLEPAPALPGAWVVLVNPRLLLPTAAVFARLERAENPGLPPMPAGGWRASPDLVDWLRGCRNDLQAPALALCPAVAEVLSALADTPLARMSGSGATCFALVPGQTEAERLAERLRRGAPGWWVAAAPLLGRIAEPVRAAGSP